MLEFACGLLCSSLLFGFLYMREMQRLAVVHAWLQGCVVGAGVGAAVLSVIQKEARPQDLIALFTDTVFRKARAAPAR